MTDLRLEALTKLMEALDDAQLKKEKYPDNALAVFALCGLVLNDLLDQVQELRCASCGCSELRSRSVAEPVN